MSTRATPRFGLRTVLTLTLKYLRKTRRQRHVIVGAVADDYINVCDTTPLTASASHAVAVNGPRVRFREAGGSQCDGEREQLWRMWERCRFDELKLSGASESESWATTLASFGSRRRFNLSSG